MPAEIWSHVSIPLDSKASLYQRALEALCREADQRSEAPFRLKAETYWDVGEGQWWIRYWAIVAGEPTSFGRHLGLETRTQRLN
jgi:hypothetical protein